MYMNPADFTLSLVSCEFDNSPHRRLHATHHTWKRTACGLRVGANVGFPLNHNHEPITWERANRDCLETCKSCRKAAPVL